MHNKNKTQTGITKKDDDHDTNMKQTNKTSKNSMQFNPN